MKRIKEKTRKTLEIIWTIIIYLILIFFIIKYIKTKDPTQIIGIAIFLILAIIMTIDFISPK